MGQWPTARCSARLVGGGRDAGKARTPELPGAEPRTQVSGLSPRPQVCCAVGSRGGGSPARALTGNPRTPRSKKHFGCGVSASLGPRCPRREDGARRRGGGGCNSQSCRGSADRLRPYRCQDRPGDAQGGGSPPLCAVSQLCSISWSSGVV